MKILLISNSTNAGEPYLQHCIEQIRETLKGVNTVLFIPYAAVTFSFDEYEKDIQTEFQKLGIKVKSIHHEKFPKEAVKQAEAIVVGGGNTFKLLKLIQQNDLIETLRYRVFNGIPYIGWSAGANVACPTICTTNDMPITEPDNLSAFNIVRFQINPHYLDVNPAGHAGETREERIIEYLEMDPYVYVVGLREGSMIKIESGTATLLGPKSARIFKHTQTTREIQPGDDIDFLFD
jgi:dipeptidase E